MDCNDPWIQRVAPSLTSVLPPGDRLEKWTILYTADIGKYCGHLNGFPKAVKWASFHHHTSSRRTLYGYLSSVIHLRKDSVRQISVYRPSYLLFTPSVGGAFNQSFGARHRVCSTKMDELCIGDPVFEHYTTCGGRCRFPTSSYPPSPAIAARGSIAHTYGPLSTSHFRYFPTQDVDFADIFGFVTKRTRCWAPSDGATACKRRVGGVWRCRRRRRCDRVGIFVFRSWL
jgi:hypothetical protein